MKEIGPRPRKYRMQGSLRISNQYTKRITDFRSIWQSQSLIYISFPCQPFAWQGHAIYASVSRKRSYFGSDFVCTKLLDGREGRNLKFLNSFQRMMAFCISVERISGNELCPIEDLKSKVSVCFSTPVLRVVPRGAENSDSDDPESVGGSCDKR